MSSVFFKKMKNFEEFCEKRDFTGKFRKIPGFLGKNLTPQIRMKRPAFNPEVQHLALPPRGRKITPFTTCTPAN
jgi:hypothetical protein